ncbi:MAG TPA: hypothetical protein ENH20_01360 [Candidatus Pacearchaeota archaeon]|nr:hypothetical protein [Candidatus Pacearchaeota archaeon]
MERIARIYRKVMDDSLCRNSIYMISSTAVMSLFLIRESFISAFILTIVLVFGLGLYSPVIYGLPDDFVCSGGCL